MNELMHFTAIRILSNDFITGPLSKMFENKIVINFLPINLNIYFGYSKEPSHSDNLLSTHNICFG